MRLSTEETSNDGGLTSNELLGHFLLHIDSPAVDDEGAVPHMMYGAPLLSVVVYPGLDALQDLHPVLVDQGVIRYLAFDVSEALSNQRG